MKIREAVPSDKEEIVALYKRSQESTGIPNPAFKPPEILGTYLYSRNAIGRYVVAEEGNIIGHGLIEVANPEHVGDWNVANGHKQQEIIELGGAFVDPSKSGRGVWSSLLIHRLEIVRSLGALPVSVTWSSNEHVKKRFIELGGREVGQKVTKEGEISLFVL